MIFKILLALVILLPVMAGSFLLLAPSEKLIRMARRGALGAPMPEPGTFWFKVLIGFYRFIGVIALGFAVFAVVMALITFGPEEKNKSKPASESSVAPASQIQR